MPSLRAATPATGSSAATAPLALISAVRPATSSIKRPSRRGALVVPPSPTRRWPIHAVTPVDSSVALTMNRLAMKVTAGSPNPARACCSVRIPVAHSAMAVANATTTTGSLFQMNRAMAAATIRPVVSIGVTRTVSWPLRQRRGR